MRTNITPKKGSSMSKNQMPKRAALLTGAAGQIGQKISDYFAGKNKSIIGLYRSQLPKAHKDFLPLCCDLTNSDAIVAPLKSTDCVVHLAWQGGVLGSNKFRGKKPSDLEIRNSYNVNITKNIISAMEKSGTRRIVFLSWVGVDRNSNSIMLREKYWAENAIINSNIPEKIIIRAGLVAKGLNENPFFKAANKFAKIPMFLPLPKNISGVVMTTLDDIIWSIENAMKIEENDQVGCRVVDLTSTAPESAASIVSAMDTKVWGKRRLTIGGLVGDALFKFTDRNLGRSKSESATLSDFFEASSIPSKCPAEGLPPTVIGKNVGHKVEIKNAF